MRPEEFSHELREVNYVEGHYLWAHIEPSDSSRYVWLTFEIEPGKEDKYEGRVIVTSRDGYSNLNSGYLYKVNDEEDMNKNTLVPVEKTYTDMGSVSEMLDWESHLNAGKYIIQIKVNRSTELTWFVSIVKPK